MQRRDAVALDRVAVLGRRVADVRANSQPGCSASARCMKRSRVTLATIEAAAIAALVASPSTTARCWSPRSGTRKPSTRHSEPGTATRTSASCRAARLVRCRPRAVDAARAAGDGGDLDGGAQHDRVERLARLRVVLLGVVERAERADLARRRARSTSKSTAAATSGPARQPRPASSAPAIQRTPRPRSNWNRRRPVRRLAAAGRRGAAAVGPARRGRRERRRGTGAIASRAAWCHATSGAAEGSTEASHRGTVRSGGSGRARVALRRETPRSAAARGCRCAWAASRWRRRRR